MENEVKVSSAHLLHSVLSPLWSLCSYSPPFAHLSLFPKLYGFLSHLSSSNPFSSSLSYLLFPHPSGVFSLLLTSSSLLSSRGRQLLELQRLKEVERERLERERQERERLEREMQERERERERQDRERQERERERSERERTERDRLERERQEKEREQLERERAERERELMEREKQERERMENETQQEQQLDSEQMDWERGRRISNAGEQPSLFPYLLHTHTYSPTCIHILPHTPTNTHMRTSDV